MQRNEVRVIVTGGAGFIGSHLVRLLLKSGDYRVLNLDALTYAGNPGNLADVAQHPLYSFEHADITDATAVHNALFRFRPHAIVNLAAETHVDRSIDAPDAFTHTNVTGTLTLLKATLAYWHLQSPRDRERFRFLQVSTDEVFGSLGSLGEFTESSPYAPRSPYAASKAAADHLVMAWHATYGLPTLITHGSNTYGPCQFPEKLIPLMTLRALEGLPLPIFGTGGNSRDWLHVEDHCNGILSALQFGEAGERYCLSGNDHCTNLQVVDAICTCLDEITGSASKRAHAVLKTFVPDRPGHDWRYACDTTKARKRLLWQPRHSFSQGLQETVQWYVAHQDWCREIRERTRYEGQRLGVATALPLATAGLRG